MTATLARKKIGCINYGCQVVTKPQSKNFEHEKTEGIESCAKQRRTLRNERILFSFLCVLCADLCDLALNCASELLRVSVFNAEDEVYAEVGAAATTPNVQRQRRN